MQPNGNEQREEATAADVKIHHSTLRRTAEWMGYPRIAPQPRIVNGNNAPGPDRYPYFVALVDDRDRIVCGGSLVASNVVLSAAHCGL
jgi:secreted trypsin-like serine protease